MTHVTAIVWVSDTRCIAECSCGWKSAEASAPGPLRVPAMVHRLAMADSADEMLSIGMSVLVSALWDRLPAGGVSPAGRPSEVAGLRCAACGCAQNVRMDVHGGIEGLRRIGWRPVSYRVPIEGGVMEPASWLCPLCGHLRERSKSDGGEDR